MGKRKKYCIINKLGLWLQGKGDNECSFCWRGIKKNNMNEVVRYTQDGLSE